MDAEAERVSAGELGSGKGHRDENFPVASLLVAAKYRAPILAFYRFARVADDVADHPDLPPPQKLALLDSLEASLLGASRSEAEGVALRTSLAERKLSPQHALDLLKAFRLDVTKSRYENWDELIDYCRQFREFMGWGEERPAGSPDHGSSCSSASQPGQQAQGPTCSAAAG